MTLGPKAEAALKDGPQYVSRNWPPLEPFQSIEGEREFARRVALIAVQEERERCATVADELGGVPPEDWQKIGAAIREGR